MISPSKSSRGRRVLLLVLVSLASAVAPVVAQRGPDGRRGPQNRAELEERFRRQMARMMQERLELDEAQSTRLSEIVRSFEAPRRELGRAEQALRRRVEALMLEGGADQTEARELLERMIELRRAEGDLFEQEQRALLEVLTPGQVLQFQAMRDQMGRRIRSLRGGGDDGRRRRGGGPPGAVGWLPEVPPGPTDGPGHHAGNVDARSGVGLSL